MLKDIQEEIIKLKKEKNVAIVAHSYMPPEVLEIADVKGDSFVLSVKASQMSENTILMCGVRFMAETVKMLSPQKKVVLAAPEAGCPMADQISPERVLAFKAEHPEFIVVAYINTTAALKSVCDICVTSSSAEQIIKKLPNKDILFIPDANLGAYIQKSVPEKNILLWDGYCPIHAQITSEDVVKSKEKHPNAKLLVHPECKDEVLSLADFVGSTSAIIDYAVQNDGEFIIGTEKGVYDYLVQQYPEKRFYLLSKKLICPDMKITSLTDIKNALNSVGGEEIVIEEQLRIKAKKCIDAMIELGN